jgi:putative transposase
VKYAWIEVHREEFSVARMCRQLQVSRTGYCQWRVRAPSVRAVAQAALDARVAAIHASSQRRYRRPRIVGALSEQGIRVGPERVRKSLQRQGLRPVYRRPYRVTTDSDHRLPVAANVLARRFDEWLPNLLG